LDELLQELLDRVGDIVDSRERLRSLLNAVVGLNADLDLASTLRRIVAAACELVGAKYGALGVIGEEHKLTEFITHGLSEAEEHDIGARPAGRGVLGLLIDDPRPVRVADITQHPASYGFPPNHPPMHSFLGVPLRVRQTVYGNLYLAEKIGGEEFTEDDEHIVVALAAAAGVAIDNANLYAIAQRRERWFGAIAEITSSLLGRVNQPAALELIALRARQVAESEMALILLHDEESRALTVEAGSVVGEVLPPALIGARLDAADSLFASAIHGRDPVRLECLNEAAAWPVTLSDRPATVIPLATGDALHGLLVVVDAPPSDQRAEDVAMLTAFAGQAALALERAAAQDERETLAILEDRERIARDLHDVVIQRLFATGLQLQSAARLARPEIAERVNIAVDDLDSTIRDIRSAIFELRSPSAGDIRAEIRALIDATASSLGHRPALELVGAIDSLIPTGMRPDLLAVLREALSNVVRHAAASSVTVLVRVDDREVLIRVTDNGKGIPDKVARSGLSNMRERAVRHKGTFSATRVQPHGTRVEWVAPIK
jgi:signal transduction histidine kinase